ncbi:error-prone DNA polymerase [Kordiimonadales bacterium JCM 17843]|nr:error-prone DNA polymerase [Kordiimonadales bacterium JCM 17843]
MSYAELQVTSNFSFLEGGSHPDELVQQAKALRLDAIALTDRNSLAGIVRAHATAQAAAMRFIVGCRLDLVGGVSFLAYPTDRASYGRLSRLLTLGKRRAEKGGCILSLNDLYAYAEGLVLVFVPPQSFDHQVLIHNLSDMRRALSSRLYLAASHSYHGDDAARINRLADVARHAKTPLLATGNVLYHVAHRRPLQDVLNCIRDKCTIEHAGFKLEKNAERHLKTPAEMARLFKGHEDALARTMEVAQACQFSLEELRYNYPGEPVPPGQSAQQHLETLAEEGAARRYPDGVPQKVRTMIAAELELIAKLRYAPYFLTVHDIVHWARGQGILCQGRGSAANSAVCYCLFITSVNPATSDLLFERFISAERAEPPDIDVDFEHERREEVMQYIYARYGRARAGIAATVISYRARSAVREVGKVMGLTEDVTAALAGTVWGWSSDGIPDDRVREAGLDPTDRRLQQTLALTAELIGFPRHLSQHVGGFVLTEDPLEELVPIGNAAMQDRTFIEWDKDDLDTLGMLKIDVLSLGMLTAIRKCFDLIARHDGRRLALGDFYPMDDTATFDMLCRGDSIGVFQVESRAQMNMLPRLKPRCFYDLVIEVSIVRPGPIQGDMVHPYLRRRDGLEAVDYPAPAPDHGPSDELKKVLGRTLGVPLFQEQAMKIAMVAAAFSGEEANQLRRAMATFRHVGTIHAFEDKLVEGMVARGYDADFARRCFKQIEGFGEYGFPESHAASFALLVYVSAFLKCHYPAAFACALLNSQPMGFYAPAQIVRDAREHGVVVRAVDVNHSHWNCTLEGGALRLGMRQVKGLLKAEIEKIVLQRGAGYEDLADLKARSGARLATIERLAEADAFRSMGFDRRQALWQSKALPRMPALPLFAHAEARETGPEAHVLCRICLFVSMWWRIIRACDYRSKPTRCIFYVRCSTKRVAHRLPVFGK